MRGSISGRCMGSVLGLLGGDVALQQWSVCLISAKGSARNARQLRPTRSMLLTMLKAKLHRATVTEADMDYEGSIAIDRDLLDESGILPHEQVDVLNINTGGRFTTYAIEAPRRPRAPPRHRAGGTPVQNR